MTRIALFGGSFNPPHIAHQLVGLYVLETQPVDEVWFVPVYMHVFGKDLASYDHRIAMCELAAAALGPRAKVSRVEAELAHRPDFVASRTLDLIEYLASQGHELRLVVGTDILGETSKWYRWDAVVAAAPLIVIGRSGHALPAGSVATGVTMPEIASTQIRELLVQNSARNSTRDVTPNGTPRDDAASSETQRLLTGLLPREVLRYIAEHNLYQGAS